MSGNSDRKEWPKVEVENLITAYESKQCLWDVNCRQHKDRRAKAEALDELSRRFNTTSAEISRKIHNLRNQFNSEMKKTLKRNSGQETTEMFVSKWPHFQSLTFLKTNIITKQEPKNLGGNESNEELETEALLEDSNTKGSNAEEDVASEEEEPTHKPKGIKRKTISAGYLVEPNLLPLYKQHDQYDIFGAYVTSEMRNLSTDYLRKKMKRKILQVILEIAEEDERLFTPVTHASMNSAL